MASFSALLLLTTLSAGGDDLVLLQFTAPWCGPCQSMEPTIRRLADDGYPVRQVNIDQHPDVARRHNVRPIPCFVLVDKGREVDRIIGATSYDRLVQMFHRGSGERRDTVRSQSPDEPPGRASAEPNGDRTQGSREDRSGRWSRFARGERHADDYQRVSGTTRHEQQPDATTSRTGQPSDNGTSSAANLDPRRRALQATVRLKVTDPDGDSFGTGTIIDVHEKEALIMTCGHVFRDSRGKGEIAVTLFLPSGEVTIPGHLLAYDADQRDVGLIFIRPSMPVVAAPVADGSYKPAVGETVFSVGCDRGAAPSLRDSRVTHVNRYLGAPNIESSGQPVDGRSGGGLFTAGGQLMGICNAADPADNEGVYAALATIHWQLDQIGQSRVYQQAPEPQLAKNNADPRIDAPPSRSAPVSDEPRQESREIASPSQAELASAIERAASDSELICILRSADDPSGRQLIVVKDPTRELVDQLRRHSQGKTATDQPLAQRTPDPGASPPATRSMTALPRTAPRSSGTRREAPSREVVRGQNAMD